MSDDYRREQLGAGCVAWLGRLWNRVLRYLRIRTDSDDHKPLLPGISIENLIERHQAPVDDPGPGNGIPRVALEVVRSDTALSSIIAAGEIVVHRGQLENSATVALLQRGRFRRIDPPGGPDELCQFARFRSPNLRGVALIELVNDLRAAGVNAGGNWIMAFGSHITMKAGGGPEFAPPGVDRAALELVAAKHRRDTDRRVTVAVIDTGVNRGGWANDFLQPIAEDPANRDVLDVINVNGQSGPDGFLDAGAGHGTFVCGLLRQFAPSADVVVYRSLDTDGIGHDEAISCAVMRAVADATRAKRALVINLSLGGCTDGDKPPAAIAHAVEAATHAGAVVVAAAGNEASPRPAWPAALPGVLAVSSLDAAGRPSTFANFGWWVDFATVGEGAVSTFVAGRESPDFSAHPDDWTGQDEPVAQWEGTSFAAPKLAAAVANLLLDGRTPAQAVADLRARGPVLKGYGTALTDDLLP